MTVQEFNFSRSADDVTVRNVVNHGVWMKAPPTSPSSAARSAAASAPTTHTSKTAAATSPTPQHPLRRSLFPRLALRLRRTHGMPADPRRRHRHHPQLHLQELRHRQQRPRRNRRPLRRLPRRHRPRHQEHPARKQLLLPLRQRLHDPDERPRKPRPPLQLDRQPDHHLRPRRARHRHGHVGNIMRYGGCTAETNGVPINWRYNVIQGGTCGATNKNAAPGFLDTNNNLHLRRNSPAINAGDPRRTPNGTSTAKNVPQTVVPMRAPTRCRSSRRACDCASPRCSARYAWRSSPSQARRSSPRPGPTPSPALGQRRCVVHKGDEPFASMRRASSS